MGHKTYDRGDPRFWGEFRFPIPFYSLFPLERVETQTDGSASFTRVSFPHFRLDDQRTLNVRLACSRGRCDCSDWILEGASLRDATCFPLSLSFLPFVTLLLPKLTPYLSSYLYFLTDRIHRPLPRKWNRLRLPLPRNPTRPRIQTHLLRRSRSRRLCGSVDTWIPIHRAGEDGVEDLEEVLW